jgi:hypothetical protein
MRARVNRWILFALGGLASSACVSTAQSVVESTLQNAILKEYALGLCETMDHESGPECEDVVDDRHARCSEPLFAQMSTTEEYVVCLGFIFEVLEPEPSPQ